MIRILFFILFTQLSCNSLFSQVGINTTDPKATLHIEPSDNINPTGTDGVLIPRLANLPANGEVEGQLVYLMNNPTENEGFYYWDGSTWVWIINNYDRTIDESTYVATGIGLTGTGNNRTLNFGSIDGFDTTGFAVSNNEITIGKSGKYLITLTASAKRFGNTTPLRQSNFVYVLYLNGNQVSGEEGRVKSSTSNEMPTATSVAFSTILDLEVGDQVKVEVFRSNENPQNFIGYGSNGLTFTFLR